MRGQSRAIAAALALAALGAARARGDSPDAAAAHSTLQEPSLAQVVEAAMRRAGGVAADDDSRLARARVAHWAPAVRAQYGVRDDDRSRRGEFRLAPLIEDDTGQSRAWAIVASWDFAQLVFAREETQLALAHVHLARVRQQAASDAARLYDERFRLRARLRALAAQPLRERAEALLALLRATAELDALTSGLYAGQVAQLDVQLRTLEPQLTLASAPSPAPVAAHGAVAATPFALPPLEGSAQEPAPSTDLGAAVPDSQPLPNAIEEDR